MICSLDYRGRPQGKAAKHRMRLNSSRRLEQGVTRSTSKLLCKEGWTDTAWGRFPLAVLCRCRHILGIRRRREIRTTAYSAHESPHAAERCGMHVAISYPVWLLRLYGGRLMFESVLLVLRKKRGGLGGENEKEGCEGRQTTRTQHEQVRFYQVTTSYLRSLFTLCLSAIFALDFSKGGYETKTWIFSRDRTKMEETCMSDARGLEPRHREVVVDWRCTSTTLGRGLRLLTPTCLRFWTSTDTQTLNVVTYSSSDDIF